MEYAGITSGGFEMTEDHRKDGKAGTHKFVVAGWMAIISAFLLLPEIALSLLADISSAHPRLDFVVMPGLITVTIAEVSLGVYALYMFKNMLNERYKFHATDYLIYAIIIGSILLGIMGIGARMLPDMIVANGIPNLLPDDLSKFTTLSKIASGLLMFTVGFPLSIITIIFAYKLLQLPGTLNGLLKPLAYTFIASSICFLTFILAFLGMAIMIAATVILGIALIRSGEDEEELEFI
jgi:hypothetical protein